MIGYITNNHRCLKNYQINQFFFIFICCSSSNRCNFNFGQSCETTRTLFVLFSCQNFSPRLPFLPEFSSSIKFSPAVVRFVLNFNSFHFPFGITLHNLLQPQWRWRKCKVLFSSLKGHLALTLRDLKNLFLNWIF